MNLLRLAVLLLLLPAAALADISGSTVELTDPPGGVAAIGELVLFRFEVSNASTDLNWIANVSFDFPECCTVVFMRFDDSESSNDWAFEYEGIGTHTAEYVDADGGWGEIPGNGDHGWFEVTVRVGEDCPEEMDFIIYILDGDELGDEPHELIDAIPITFDYVPVSKTSLSAVKGAY